MESDSWRRVTKRKMQSTLHTVFCKLIAVIITIATSVSIAHVNVEGNK